MIEIRINYDTREISVDGHANSAEYGHDLICAAASILVQTMNRMLNRFPDVTAGTKIESGKAYICWSGPGKHNLADYTVKAIADGFYFLAEEYPDNVTLYLSGPMADHE